MVATFFFFGYSALIKTCFLLDYTWMSAQSETMTMSLMYLVASGWYSAWITADLVFRVYHNMPITFLMGEELKAERAALDVPFLLSSFAVMVVLHLVALAAKVFRYNNRALEYHLPFAQDPLEIQEL